MRIQRIATWMLSAGCVFLSSCSKMDVSSPEDYIGPGPALSALGASAVTAEDVNSPKVSEPNAPLPGEQKRIAPTDPSKPLALSVEQAIVLALENNKSLLVQKLNPQINRTRVKEAWSQFEPDLTASFTNDQSKLRSRNSSGILGRRTYDHTNTAEVGIEEFLPTGTLLNLTGRTTIDELDPDFYASRGEIAVTQSLLRGFGTQVNLVTVNQAKIDAQISEYELRGFVETLVSQTEQAYWNYVYAQRQIQIFQQSVEIAAQQLRETQERVKVGKLAQSELAAAQAELASRQENLINAKSTFAQRRLELLRLTSPPGEYLWERQLKVASEPVLPEFDVNQLDAQAVMAMQMRPDLNQAKLQIERDELELVRTRNGLLPRLDAFIAYGRTGYADSFGRSVKRIGSDNNWDTLAGVDFEYPVLNTAARARHLRAKLSRTQSCEALVNLEQLVQVDVRVAHLEVIRAKEQIPATAATSIFKEETLRAETEKFRVGKSTPFLVAQAQRDLVVSQIAELQARIGYINAVTEFYRLQGTLLERRGIQSPGKEPVKLTKKCF